MGEGFASEILNRRQFYLGGFGGTGKRKWYRGGERKWEGDGKRK
jgi:hypothetical protein